MPTGVDENPFNRLDFITYNLNYLHEAYKAMPWYKQFFFPEALRLALDKYSEKLSSNNMYAVLDAFAHQTWFFQRWFFTVLYDFSQSRLFQCFSRFENTLLLVDESVSGKKDKLLLKGDMAQANLEALAARRENYKLSLLVFHQLDLPQTQERFDAICAHPYPDQLSKALDLILFSDLSPKKAECYADEFLFKYSQVLFGKGLNDLWNKISLDQSDEHVLVLLKQHAKKYSKKPAKAVAAFKILVEEILPKLELDPYKYESDEEDPAYDGDVENEEESSPVATPEQSVPGNWRQKVSVKRSLSPDAFFPEVSEEGEQENEGWAPVP